MKQEQERENFKEVSRVLNLNKKINSEQNKCLINSMYGINKAESKKTILENRGFSLINTLQNGFNKSVLVMNRGF